MQIKQQKSFFGQPRGLATLFFTELWERFSFYGMRAILLYYIIAKVSTGGLGMSHSMGLAIVSIYSSMVYLSSILGGFLSDRILGAWRTVFTGGVLIMFGHITLALPFGRIALFISLALIVMGTGMLKPNVSEMVGSLYSLNDTRRDAGFSIFVFGINFGAFIAPLLVGQAVKTFNYHTGFLLAAIGMLIGLIVFRVDSRNNLSKATYYPSDPLQPEDIKPLIFKLSYGLIAAVLVIILMYLYDALNLKVIILLLSVVAVMVPVIYFVTMLTSRKTTREERSRVRAYIPLFLAAMLFWSIEEQGAAILALFARDQVRLPVGFNAAWLQSLNPMFIMLYTPIFALLWVKLGKRQPKTPTKFGIGLVFAGISFLTMAIPGFFFGINNLVSPLWLILSWALVEVAELLISPVGLSATTKLAPRAFRSQMMSMWFLSDAAASAINAQLVQFYTVNTEVRYFTIAGGVTIIAGLLLLTQIKKITAAMIGVD
ncbi:peptide MFS transporter [Periweissella fabaria]|uniref:Di-/tripeptide transporter n=1 Tax=Periweissella fabaria TaxID=546157 RepID=A0ABM8Z7R3_9LACO|nr:peptide MFS transporter [Periweissella fabaria]MCM0598013.1 peptide MFS transporter [Periweissella fabaria]CAH0417386.1 Di-/tripeptide transporter [Periweissella fabaria]